MFQLIHKVKLRQREEPAFACGCDVERERPETGLLQLRAGVSLLDLVAVGEIRSRFGADGYGPSLYISDLEGNLVELKGPPTRAGKP